MRSLCIISAHRFLDNFLHQGKRKVESHMPLTVPDMGDVRDKDLLGPCHLHVCNEVLVLAEPVVGVRCHVVGTDRLYLFGFAPRIPPLLCLSSDRKIPP